MRLADAETLTLSLMSRHGLDFWAWRWRLRWMQSKRYAGRCNYGLREIALSAPIVKANGKHAVVNLILHEIAHALTTEKHDHKWMDKLKEIGGRVEVYPDLKLAKGKYEIVCPRHRVVGYSDCCWRKVKERDCRMCWRETRTKTELVQRRAG